MKVLVLFSRLTNYWMSCMRYDHENNMNSYLVIRQQPSADAPFRIFSEDGISILDDDVQKRQNLIELVKDFNPTIIYVSGWSNRFYLQIARKYKQLGISIICGMDNQWLGTYRQYLASIFSNIFVKKYFTHIWIPGRPQYLFAKRLGFKESEILTGLYCADENSFKSVKQTKFQPQITFIGRLVEHKGFKQLMSVLDEFIKEGALNINVHIIGNGPLEGIIPNHPKIKHTPFVDPKDLPELLTNAGFFILPSLYEAWGVVVHEAVLAGLPVITTYECAAGTEFVIQGYNGFKYSAGNIEDLKAIIKRIANVDSKSYFEMSNNSKELSSRATLEFWSAQLNSCIN